MFGGRFVRGFIPDPRFSNPTQLGQGMAAIPVSTADWSIQNIDPPQRNKRQRIEDVDAPFPYSETTAVQVREGKGPMYLLLKWNDSSGNGSVKNYTSFQWQLTDKISGYSKCSVISSMLSNLYTTNTILMLGIQINEITSPLRTSLLTGAQLSPTFMVPNQTVSSTGVLLPSGSALNYVSYAANDEKPSLQADVRGLTLQTLTCTLGDQELVPLTIGASTTGFTFNLLLRFD